MNEQQLIERLERSVGGRERLAGFYAARTLMDTNKRADMELRDGAATILDAVERTEKAITAAGLQDYWTGADALVNVLVRAWAMYQHAGSRTMNWFVTGASNFPVRRNEKRMESEHKRLTEYLDIAKTAPERAVRIAKRSQKAQLGAGGIADMELQDLRKRLADRQARQEHMKAVNALIRKNKLGREDALKLAELAADAGLSMGVAHAENLLTPDWGSPGYPSYSLSNNNAEIHRLQDRVRQVEAKVQRIESAPEEAPEREENGVRVIEDSADDRLRLVFPGKPSGPIIQALKSSGFRWSPTNGAWQRQLTPNARSAAARVLAVVQINNKEAA